MSTLDSKCGYAQPGTFGHECGRQALFAGSTPSERTKSGVFWHARCGECKDLKGPDNRGVQRWEPLDPAKHVNEWKAGAA